ncbi:MAG: 7TM diverse intracellular signaling domain-containing protein [Flavobacteriales bacterium]
MLRFFLMIGLLFSSLISGAEDPIQLRPGNLGMDRAKKASYFVDPDASYTIQKLLEDDRISFAGIEGKRKNFGFTQAAYWVRFQVWNRMGKQRRFLLEPSRPLTNKVKLFRVKGDSVLDSASSGDHVPYHERPYAHRRIVFPVQLDKGEKATFYVRLKGDGEALMFPLKVWSERAFNGFYRDERLALGIFYGFLLFVVLIFTFFYFTLRERSFLYYTLYVLSFAFLQFALDGLAYRYFFSDNSWLADRGVITVSYVTVIMVTLYARTYLRVWEKSLKLDRIYRLIMVIGGLGLLGSLFQGATYSYGYPFVNGLSFGGTLFILVSIFFLKKRGYDVSNWFLLAFILLISGVITFLVGNMGLVPPNVVTINGLKMGSLCEVICLSFTMVEKYRELQKEKEKERKNSLERLQELNRVKDEYNKELEATVEERTKELQEEREKLRDTNQEIMSSIRYGEHIQKAILPPHEAIQPFFRDHFILYRPRDIVSGDIYWFASVTTTKGEEEGSSVSREISKDLIPDRAELTVFSAMDCTGHGVPGAFLSILGHDALNRTLKEPAVNSPGEALTFVDRAVRNTFDSASGSSEKVDDGMDMGMVALDHEHMRLQFAGANHPCYIVRKGELHELRGDKMGIGGSSEEGEKVFHDRFFELQKGDCIYLFSDGYPDQFGGPKGKKFKYKTFKDLLCRIHDESMGEQKRILDEAFDSWKGEHEQVDDVMVIGVRV